MARRKDDSEITAIFDTKATSEEQWRSLNNTFQTAARIMTGKRVEVKALDFDKEIHSGDKKNKVRIDGNEITFNTANTELQGISTDTITDAYGTFYHGMSRVQYTPSNAHMSWRTGDDSDVNKARQSAFEILEGQRTENLIAAQYPSTEGWMLTSTMRWLAQSDDPTLPGTAFVALTGRDYVPNHIKEAAKRDFKSPQVADRIAELIDDYSNLVLPRDMAKAEAMITKFIELMDEAGISQEQQDDMSPFGEYEAGNGSGDGDQDKAQQQRQQGDGDGEGNDDNESDDDSDSDNDGGKAAAQKMLDRMNQNQQHQEDVQRAMRKAGNAAGTLMLNRMDRSEKNVPSEARIAANRFQDALHVIETRADPGWDRRTATGRLNPARYAVEHNPDEAFDSWYEGINDTLDVEAVFMGDASASMSGNFDRASQVMWVLKRALDQVGARTTVLGFAEEAYVIYGPDEEVHPQKYRNSFACGGSTIADDAAVAAARILTTSNRRVKVLFTLTDGAWHSGGLQGIPYADETIKHLTKLGVHTALLFFNEYGRGSRVDPHGHRHAQEVNNVGDVSAFTRAWLQRVVSDGVDFSHDIS